jgi:hypothetical protein
MAESAGRDDQDVAERQDRETDADDAATDGQPATEGDRPDSGNASDASAEPQGESDAESQADAGSEAQDDTGDTREPDVQQDAEDIEANTADGVDDDADDQAGDTDEEGDDEPAQDVEDVEDADDDAGEAKDADGEDAADETHVAEDADADEGDEAEGDVEPEEEPRERLHADTLIARYRLLGGPTGYMLPWSWSDLPPAETDALVEVVDAFVESYNNLWALTESDTVPPCWHHHAALAHDLAALAWGYFQAYRDPNATPELALRFQAHLPRFRERMDYWLGADPAACRDGRHSRSWRPRMAPAASNPRDSAEERDAVILLGADDLGFPRQRTTGAPDD